MFSIDWLMSFFCLQGKCSCFPGWKGELCSQTCDKGFFGLECNQRCKCVNDGQCRAVDGTCFCPPGYMGTFCSETCMFKSNVE